MPPISKKLKLVACPLPGKKSASRRSIPFAFCEDNGLTLVEVMVAALVMTLLVGNLLGMVVYAEMFRLKAKQSSDSRSWIQQDIENVKFKASQFSIASLSTAANASDTSITVNQTSVGGIALATGDILKIGTNPSLHTLTAISGTTLSFTPGLSVNQASCAQVWASGTTASPKLCNATSSTTGLAQVLSASLDPVTTSAKTIGGISYTLNRIATPSNIAPYQRLTVAYSVVPSGGGTSVLSLQTEVIPYAAFGCP